LLYNHFGSGCSGPSIAFAEGLPAEVGITTLRSRCRREGRVITDRWIEQSLYRLAETAWRSRRTVATTDFVLQPDALPTADNPESMTTTVERMYAHARKWAPGFEVPYRTPKVNVLAVLDSAGQYRVDVDGYLFIEVSERFILQRDAVLGILAHEACHHILDLSGTRSQIRDESERLTDLAAFVCGFGQIILNGQTHIQKVGSVWVTTHLGYLSQQQYRFAQQWVLHAQGLGEASSSDPSRRRGVFSSLRQWWQNEGTSTNNLAYKPTLSQQSLIDVGAQRHKTALARLNGDRALLQRLLEYERRRHPDFDELTLLDAVIESLDRDRR